MDGSSVKFPKTSRKGGLIGWKYVGCAVIKIGFGGLYGGFVYWWVVTIGGATFVWHGLCFWNCREKNFLGGGGADDFTTGFFFLKGLVLAVLSHKIVNWTAWNFPLGIFE